jgi:hypothetical protein
MNQRGQWAERELNPARKGVHLASIFKLCLHSSSNSYKNSRFNLNAFLSGIITNGGLLVQTNPLET